MKRSDIGVFGKVGMGKECFLVLDVSIITKVYVSVEVLMMNGFSECNS